MSKMSQLAHEMDECSTFSAWSADGKTEVQLEAPIDPDRLDQGNYINNSDTVVDERVDVDDYPMNGQITFLEPHEIHTIHFLSENTDDEYDRIVLKQIYERVK
jgi:hypothetical protein|tara:strand:+ start:392 stop:700 length:309 start_codon:yes stop_codon:yes gene_type:complete